MNVYRMAAAVAALLTCSAMAWAADLPTFEVDGQPITAHQAALLGLPNVEERMPTSSITVMGMPASPHQIAVLSRREKTVAQQPSPLLTDAAVLGVKAQGNILAAGGFSLPATSR